MTYVHAVSQGRRIPVFRDPALSNANHPGADFVIEESDTQLESVARAYLPHTTLLVCTGRSGTAHWKPAIACRPHGGNNFPERAA